jgi:hypothetical protein
VQVAALVASQHAARHGQGDPLGLISGGHDVAQDHLRLGAARAIY